MIYLVVLLVLMGELLGEVEASSRELE